MFSAIGELRTAGIETNTREYAEQLQNMADEELIAAPNYDQKADHPTNKQAAANHLQQALKHHKTELARSVGPYENEHEIARLERTISRIQADIQKLNPAPVHKQPDRPALSAEQLAAQQKADKEVMDSLNRFDANNQQQALAEPEDFGSGENWGEDDFDEGDED